MDRTAATHSSHDELLIVRLFGGDVDDRERARALATIGECDACAALFGDLGGMADAMVALPVPARPGDFALTEVEAARLRRARRRFGFLSTLRRTRALGGALVAIGLVGIVATSSLTFLSGPGTTSRAHNQAGSQSGYRPEFGTAGPAGIGALPSEPASFVPALGRVTLNGSMSEATGTPDAITKAATSTSAPRGQVAAAADSPALAATSAVPANAFGIAGSSAGTGAGSPDGHTTTQTTTAGLDARLVWLGGFFLLFLAGLGVLVGPRVRRRRAR